MSNRRAFLGGGLSFATAAGLGLLAPRAEAAKARIGTSILAPGITLLDGAGCNVVAVHGAEGSLLVDGGYAANAKALLRAASQATRNARVATLINTHWHPAQTGANEIVGKDGAQIISHEVTRLYLGRAVTSVDYEGQYGPLSPPARPAKTTRTSGSLTFDGRQVDYGYLPAAHTSGDLYVHLPEANLLITGGPVTSEGWPILDYRNGAWLGGLAKGHEKLAALVKPDTIVVPANGKPITGADLKQQHERYAAFHEQMVVFQNKGMDSGDCIAAKPLKAFEPQYGDATTFIYGAFQSLNLAYSPD